MLKVRFDEVTKAQLKTVAKSKPTFRCAKHSRYNPVQGRGLNGVISRLRVADMSPDKRRRKFLI